MRRQNWPAAALAHIEAQHGGVPAYLRAIGLTDSQVAVLRAMLAA